MLRTLTIKNFKSIVDLTLELGRFNVFIGENGCGKSNILEAVAMVAGVEGDRLSNEDLMLRGMRVAKPSMMSNAFVGAPADALIEIGAEWGPGTDEVSLPIPSRGREPALVRCGAATPDRDTLEAGRPVPRVSRAPASAGGR